MINDEHKNILITILFIVTVVLLLLGNRNEKSVENIRYFYRDIEGCLQNEKITFKQTARELFEECRDYEDLDEIESCMDNQEIEAEKTLGEYFQECEQGVIDYYNYMDAMQDAANSDREPRVR